MGNDSRIIQIPAVLESANRKADRSVSLRFTTLTEITTDELMIMDSYFQNAGHLLFKENEFKEIDIPKEDVQVDTEKSQGTQVRDALWVLYRAWGNDAADKDNWNRFYREKMQAFKARILDEVHKIEDK